jgi:acyl-CoA thioesterase
MPESPPTPGPHPVAPLPDLYHAARHGFHHEVGFRVDPTASGRGYCTVSGHVERRHLNINGVVHGGVYATILDTAMGASVISMLEPGETTATASLYVEFLRAAREGTVLHARGELIRRGHHLAFVEGELRDGKGERLGRGHGMWYIWSADSPEAGTEGSTPQRST